MNKKTLFFTFKNRKKYGNAKRLRQKRIKKQFNIREENGEVKIDYPVVIIRAVKKEVKPNLPATGEVYVAK